MADYKTKARKKALRRQRHATVNYDKIKSREYKLQERTVLAFLQPKYMSDKGFNQFINQAASDMLARFGIDTIVLGLKHWKEMRVLQEEDMERNGWIHSDRVFLLKEDVNMADYSQEDLEKIMSTFIALDEEE